jgi:hypothetical protein
MFYGQCWKCGERWALGTASTCKCPDETPKREWVGLTGDEMKKTWYEMQNIMGWYSFEEIAKAIEAKLKEKNT